MPVDLSDTLVVGISSTALFDLTRSNEAFARAMEQDRDDAILQYREQQRALENDPLEEGTGYPVVAALLALNEHVSEPPPLVEVIVVSRNSPETGLRVLNEIERRELAITRAAFTGGEPVAPYLRAFSIDLFLTANADDAQQAVDLAACAAAVLRPRPERFDVLSEGRIRIAFDGDAVLFDEESELIFKTRGLDDFAQHELEHRDEPLGDGPYAPLLRKLARLQDRLPTRVEFSPVRIAIVTARNAPAHLRVIKTLRKWDVYVDEAFFLGGLDKAALLQALQPHIFFDDQPHHVDGAAPFVPSGQVPYATKSPLRSVTRADESGPVEGTDTASHDGGDE